MNHVEKRYTIQDSNYYDLHRDFTSDYAFNMNDSIFYYSENRLQLKNEIRILNLRTGVSKNCIFKIPQNVIDNFLDFRIEISSIYISENEIYIYINKSLLLFKQKIHSTEFEYIKSFEIEGEFQFFVFTNNAFYFVQDELTSSANDFTLSKFNTELKSIKTYTFKMPCWGLSKFHPRTIVDFSKDRISISNLIDYKIIFLDYNLEPQFIIEKENFRSISSKELATEARNERFSKYSSQEIFNFLSPRYEKTLSRVEATRFINDSTIQVIYFTEELYSDTALKRWVDVYSIKGKKSTLIKEKMLLATYDNDSSPKNRLSSGVIINCRGIKNNKMVTTSLNYRSDNTPLLRINIFDVRL